MTEEERLKRRLARSDAVGQLDPYPSCWMTYDGGQSVCVLTSATGQMVRGVGVDHDAARADALRLAGERFGR